MRYLGCTIDFTRPHGAPALAPAAGLSWQVFKNPVTLFVGGVTAVLMELAEPRVRTGVWDHTTFRARPLRRMRRTGFAALITVYAPRDTAETVIGRIGRMHGRVQGTTPEGLAYRADDPDLLDWVQLTASYGFLEAYARFAGPLSRDARDQFYREGMPAARLFGALGAPHSLAEAEAMIDARLPTLRSHGIVTDFLAILDRLPAGPWPLGRWKRAGIQAAIDLLPPHLADRLALRQGLSPWQTRRLTQLARIAERVPVPFSPPVQACRRMGLSPRALYGIRASDGATADTDGVKRFP